MPEMAKPLFDAARIHHMHPAQFQPHISARCVQRLENMSRHIRRNIDLPTQLSDVRHPVNPCQAHANLDRLRRAKGVHIIAKIRGRDGLQKLACLGAHHGQHTFARCHIGNDHAVIAHMPFQPGLVRQPCRSRGHHQIRRLAQPGDCHIGLDTAAIIQKLRIDDLSFGHVILPASHIVQKGAGIWPFDAQLAKGRHVVHRQTAANGTVFFGHVFKEILPFPAVFIFRRLTFAGKPIGPFPPRKFTHYRAMA